MTLRNRYPLSSSFSTTTCFLYLYHFLSRPPTHYMGSARWACHTLRDMLSVAAYRVCLWNWSRCSDDVARQAGYTKDRQMLRERDRVSARGSLFPERNIDLIISSSLLLAPARFLCERGWVTKTGERIEADGEWRRQRERETDKGLMAPQLYSLGSAVYSNGTGSRLIIYPHNLSSGVAPKHSIITTSARAAVKHFSQQALKMLYLSIWNAHPSCSSSSLSITSY